MDFYSILWYFIFVSSFSFKRITDTLNGYTDGLFCGRAFDGEGVGRGTGHGFLYARQILDGTDYGCLAMAAMHVLDTVNGHIGV
jgi:hypothetical protein